MNSRTASSALASFVALSIGIAAADGPAPPPVAPAVPVTDEYYGHKIVDPYRYMEDLMDPKVQDWIKAQADYTAGVLTRIPAREKLLQRIHELNTTATARVSDVQILPGGVLFYEKTLASENVGKLYVRHGYQGEEKLLIDPAKLDKSGGPPHVINYYQPSFDGQHVVAGISEGGSEQAVIHIVDTATAGESPETIDRARFGIVTWKDSKSFLYNREQKMLPGMPATEGEQKSVVWLHTIGADVETDVPILGYDRSPLVKIQPIDITVVGTDPTSPIASAVLLHGVQNEVDLYAAPLASLNSAGNIPWKKIADSSVEITAWAQRGDDLYLLSHQDAPRFQILRTSLSHPDLAHATVVLPQSDVVLTGLSTAKDALYVRALDGPIGRLIRVPYTGGAPERIQLPFDGDVQLSASDSRVPGILVVLTSWVKAARIYAYYPDTKQLKDTGLQPLGKFDDPSDVASDEVKVPSYDGALIPLSIIHRKDIKLDGSNPVLLDGYGAYGITTDPAFNPRRLAWLEQGGILAFAHVRGGGVYGENWHRAGYKLTKPNTWRDFIACGEYLVQQKYTSPRKLAGIGGSAGGILIGRAITERPDLFAAAIDQVGLSDTLRMEFTENGVPNIPEFGSVKTQDGFEDLYTMSSYEHVAPGTPFPAVMLTTGINDPRVAPWEAAKMTARLQAATSSGKPVLLRVDYEAGHGVGNTKTQREKENADEWSFLLWQFGIPEFQPAR
jgi:prolyl oligopeptidase